MSTHPSFTITDVRIFDGLGVHEETRGGYEKTHVRVVGGRIDAIGDAAIAGRDDVLIDGRGGTLLPGLIDAHVHLLPGCTRLAAVFGVTTLIDQFSKPEVIEAERAATAQVRADLRASGIGATAPGGHPTMAYAPIPYVTGPQDAAPFVQARLKEGATHLKVIFDDGSGAMFDIPTLDTATIEALVHQAHEHGLPVVAHASTAAGAVTVAKCGVDVLAHAPFDPMSDDQVEIVARQGCALIATLSVVDGFPNTDGVLPLLTEPALASRLPARWRTVLDGQSRRWMPPQPPDGAAPRRNTLALLRAGTPVLAGTDTPNPGLVFGASLHRELRHLVAAGLRPAEALAAATAVPAKVFGLADRGRIAAGHRADLLLEEAVETLRTTGLSCLAEPWWARRTGQDEWQRAHLVEVRPDRVRLRWADPMADQDVNGQWFDIDDIDLSYERPLG